MKKGSRIILGSFLLILLLVLVVYVFYPSYLSVYSVCSPDSFEEDFGDRYYIAGSVTQEEENVTLYLEENYDLKTLKHEYIHLFQFSQNRLYGCNRILLKYFNEVEAYSMSNLPNRIYNWFYPGLFENS